jgi:hypothetical protein
MVRAARTLLSSVTRVLLLADIVVVKQLLLAKDRVSTFYILYCLGIVHKTLLGSKRRHFEKIRAGKI